MSEGKPGAAYRGRFAPSPTGPLHLGSLFTAAGSYLQARAQGGEWLLRMEDLDTPRVIPDAAGDILRTLECFGFEWDGPVLRQSTRTEAYETALQRLQSQGNIAADQGKLCFRADSRDITFLDRLQGPYTQNVAAAVGDFPIRRHNGLFAYQLAVVVDDAWQGITEVVRGYDLLDNTPRQILLQEALNLPTPAYLHLPLLTEYGGVKLAKSRRSIPLAAAQASRQLWQVFSLMRLPLRAELSGAPTDELWKWAIAQWDPLRLRGLSSIELKSLDP